MLHRLSNFEKAGSQSAPAANRQEFIEATVFSYTKRVFVTTHFRQ
jgi:hypothetical protein